VFSGYILKGYQADFFTGIKGIIMLSLKYVKFERLFSMNYLSRLTLAATILVSLISGCATQASLTLYSQPEGAYFTENGSGKSYGIAPIKVYYDGVELLKHKNSDGCFLVKGFEARWISGATASLKTIRLCGSNVGDYNITYSRNSSEPGFDKDMQFALQVKSVRAQQRQAQAAKDAAFAGILSAFSTQQQNRISCTTNQVGDTVFTNCR